MRRESWNWDAAECGGSPEVQAHWNGGRRLMKRTEQNPLL